MKAEIAVTYSEKAEPPTWEEWARANVQSRLWGTVAVVFLFVLGWTVSIIRAGWHMSERQGWIAQTRTIPVDLNSEWAEGTYRDCISNGKGGFLNCPQPGTGDLDLLKNPLPEREFHVAFWGNIDQDGTKTLLWHCKRERDVIICHPRP